MSAAANRTCEPTPANEGSTAQIEVGSGVASVDSFDSQSAFKFLDYVPMACAVLKVEVDEDTGLATDVRYVHASKEYGRVIRRSVESFAGLSYLEYTEGEAESWLDQCYRVVVNGETINGFEYSLLAHDWVCYCLAPMPMKGYCLYTLITAAVDDQQREQLMATADARTSLLIAEGLSVLSAEQSYEAAMNGILDMVWKAVHAERLCVFECANQKTQIIFELCAENVPPQIGLVFKLPSSELKRWFRGVLKDPMALVPDIAILERFSKPLYDWCVARNVKSLMAAPFFSDGEIVGFLGAYNYQLDETIDLNRLFAAVSSFIAARIDNHRLIGDLEWARDHDVLTGLYNRRGSRSVIDDALKAHPDGPCVLALLDIDDFKRINDVYGHAVGDEALTLVAQALTQAFPDALLTRNGGDEFLFLLTGESAEGAEKLFEAFSRQDLSLQLEDKRCRVTTSIGYAVFPEQASSAKELYSRADAALYAVKMAGKAGFGKYAPEEDGRVRSQLGFTARDIVDNVPYPMFVHDSSDESSILFASAETVQLLGFEDMHDLIRASNGVLAGIMHPDDCERILAELAQRISNEDADNKFALDFRALMKSGEYKSLHATCNLVDIAEVGKVFYTLLAPDDE